MFDEECVSGDTCFKVPRKDSHSVEMNRFLNKIQARQSDVTEEVILKVKATMQTWAESLNRDDGPAVELPKVEVFEDDEEPQRVEVFVKHTVASAQYFYGDCGKAGCERRCQRRDGPGRVQVVHGADVEEGGGGSDLAIKPVQVAGIDEEKFGTEEDELICVAQTAARKHSRWDILFVNLKYNFCSQVTGLFPVSWGC